MLQDVHAQSWTAMVDADALARKEKGAITLPLLDHVFDDQAETLLHLGVLDEKDVADFRAEFLHLDEGGIAAVSFPTSHLILVSPAYADSVEVLAHELGHMVTAERGYTCNVDRITLQAEGGEPTAAWIDLDAMLALWLAEEADAEMTSRVALAFAKGGEAAVEQMWQHELPEEKPDVVGPATLRMQDGSTIRLGSGEGFFFKKSILQDLTKLAYGGSLRLVQARHEAGEGLEETLQRMWSRFSFTTREVLFPADSSDASRLGAAARKRGKEAVGATRIGALLVRELLERRGHLSREQASKFARQAEDDIVLRVASGSLLWIIRWQDERIAKDFSGVYKPLATGVTVETVDEYSVITWGSVPDGAELVRRLTDK